MNSDIPTRPTYVPSGRIDAARLPLALLIFAGWGMAVTGGFLRMILWGPYPPIGSVGAVLLFLIGGTWWAVKYGRWRNQRLAIAVAIFAGLFGYIAYYHLDQCIRWHVPWTAIGRLPGYVAFRVATDQWVRHNDFIVLQPLAPAPGQQPVAPVINLAWLSLNGLHFLHEVGFITLIAAAAASYKAGLPFSERGNRWLSSQSCWVHSAAAQRLLEAHDNQTVENWAASRVPKLAAGQRQVKVAVWYCPAAAMQQVDLEAYLRIGDGPLMLLAPGELAALVGLMPSLQEIAGVTREQFAQEAQAGTDAPTARIEAVPAPFAGLALTPTNRRLAALVSEGAQVAIPLLCILLSIGGLFVVDWLQQIGVIPLAADWTMLISLLVGGGVSLGVAAHCFNPKVAFVARRRTRFERRKLMQALSHRADPLVPIDDASAIFVAMLPRTHWGAPRKAPLGEFDHGLLRVDGERREILVEADRERYVIPAAVILDCTYESLPMDENYCTIPECVVVQARLGTGVWEFPFVPQGHAEENQRLARALFAQIYRIRWGAAETEDAEPVGYASA